MASWSCPVCGEEADADLLDPHGHFAPEDEVIEKDMWCDALYYPYGRKQLGGVRCRLRTGHDGDHWCEAEARVAQ